MSRQHKTVGERRHLERVASLGCCVCRRLGLGYRQAQVHHIGEGSSRTTDYATVALCVEHHDPNKTGSGFHGMGAERFCKIFRVPWEREEGLLVWVNEDLASNREAA